MTTISLPSFALVVLMGTSSSGKSTFARKHFRSTEILSSDCCRALVSDDENDQTVSDAAFDLLHFMLAKRLSLKKLCVIDATNLERQWREPFTQLAKKYHAPLIAIVFDVPEKVAIARNHARTDRNGMPDSVISEQRFQFLMSMLTVSEEGFDPIIILDVEEIAEAVIEVIKI